MQSSERSHSSTSTGICDTADTNGAAAVEVGVVANAAAGAASVDLVSKVRVVSH